MRISVHPFLYALVIDKYCKREIDMAKEWESRILPYNLDAEWSVLGSMMILITQNLFPKKAKNLSLGNRNVRII